MSRAGGRRGRAFVRCPAWTLCLLVWGCADRPSPTPGTHCALNSECAAPLVCRLERCRRECRNGRDCGSRLACVRDSSGLGACEIAEERCRLASDCPASLVCRNGRCTNRCADESDCSPGTMCQPDDDGVQGCIDRATVDCVYDSDCDDERLVCAVDRRCREECHADRDCRDGRRCDTTAHPYVCRTPPDAGRVDSTVIDGGPPDAGPPPDTGPCLETPCRLLPPQCGCASGEVCGITPAFDVGCMPPGTLREGEVCDGMGMCGAGLMCGWIGITPGVCTRFCDRTLSTDPCAGLGRGSICAALADGAGMLLIPDVGTCTASCDPLGGGAGCPAPLACGFFFHTEPGGPPTPGTHCVFNTDVPEGDPCPYRTSCQTGLYCDAGTCRRLCEVGSGLRCGTGTSCTPFDPPGLVEVIEYGRCLPG